MLGKEMLTILVCPIERTPLTIADDQLIARLNRAIAAGRMKNQAGRPVEQPLSGGLVRADNAFLYPVRDNIPVLLADEAIPLAQIRGPERG